MDYDLLQLSTEFKDVTEKEIKRDNDTGLEYISKRAYNRLIHTNRNRVVTGTTNLGVVKQDSRCNKLLLSNGIEDRYFKYKPTKPGKNVKLWHHVKGYLELSDGNFVAVVQPSLLMFLLPILLLLIIGAALAFINKGDLPIDVPQFDIAPEHSIEEAEKQEGYSETIDIPGYSRVELTSEKKELQLINPEGNTVYFVYTVQADGEEFTTTDAIIPGNSIMLDMWSKLESGDHNVTLAISTYDVETKEPCNGTSQDIVVSVTK